MGQALGQQPVHARPDDRHVESTTRPSATTLANLGMTDVRFPKTAVPGRFGQGCARRCGPSAPASRAQNEGHRQFLPRDDEPGTAFVGGDPAEAAACPDAQAPGRERLMRSLLFVSRFIPQGLMAKAAASGADVYYFSISRMPCIPTAKPAARRAGGNGKALR